MNGTHPLASKANDYESNAESGRTMNNLRRHLAEGGETSKSRKSAKWWHLWAFLGLLGLDVIASIFLLSPLVPKIASKEDIPNHYTVYGSLWDIALLAIPRILAALFCLAVSYNQPNPPPSSPFNWYHENGDRKTRIELEEEAMEEPFLPKLQRHVSRMPFLCESSVVVGSIWIAIKCLSRLNVEIGLYDEAQPRHPLFWIAIAISQLIALLEATYLDSVERTAGDLGRRRRRHLAEQHEDSVGGGASVASSTWWVERVSESLAQPLLSRVNSDVGGDLVDEETGDATTAFTPRGGKGVNGVNGLEIGRVAVSDIQGDAEYSATWSDVLGVCRPDMPLILLATIFLLAAAIANVYVPKFTGQVLDSLVAHQQHQSANSTVPNGNGTDTNTHHSIVHIPGFLANIELLLLASILGGVFGGIRLAIFTMVGARVNVRLRIRLMDNLLSQDIGFYDTTRTGDITSRLSSDTTLVGMSITNNVNTFLNSVVQAVGVLGFMFFISWQLSVLAFVTVPAVSIMSKWYGRYLRRLTRLQQKKLAEGNSVSEASISAMPTVRAFGAESVELTEFERCMEKFLVLNKHAAVTALGYNTCVNSLPEIVKAVVLFYGGLLVQSDGPSHITGGQLVSFILYLSSLSQAFNSLGGKAF